MGRAAAHLRFGLALVAALLGTAPVIADCALLHESFESPATIISNGGVVTGPLTFTVGVNGQAAACAGNAHVTYTDAGFVTDSGSISLWVRQTATDTDGGILQIGTLGQPGSLGLFYVNDTDLIFELRTNAGDLAQVYAPARLSTTQWTHVVGTWASTSGSVAVTLSIDGFYVDYAAQSGAFVPAAGVLQVGTTGWYGNGTVAIDELRVFDWDLLDGEVYGEYVWSSNRFCRQPTGKPVSTGPVQLIDGCLYVEGRPFEVKGVGYAPTPIGEWPGETSIYTNSAILARDVAWLRALHANTVRTWSQPPNATLLDALYYNGGEPIYTIVGYWIPVTGVDYGDPATRAYYEASFRSVVSQFKNRPGLLAWGIGNEVNLHLTGQALADWYSLANRLAQVAYEEEGAAYHPTLIVNGGLLDLGNVDAGSDDASLNYVDLWGMNIYFGWDARCHFDYYSRLSAKPVICTEYGIDALDNRTGAEYLDVHAAWIVRQWRQIETACLGATLMAYSDEWWKADDPDHQDFGGYGTRTHPDGYSNEEWWGLLWAEDNGSNPDILHPRPAFYALADEYAHSAGDYDDDDDIDLHDYAALQTCAGSPADGLCAAVFDFVVDDAIDFADFQPFEMLYWGPESPVGCAAPVRGALMPVTSAESRSTN